MTTAEVFRKFSRSESLSASDRDAALLWLRRLRGFSKTETDAWLFVADCISGHAELFARADDKQVLFLTEQKFRAYLKYEREKEAERQKLFHVTALDAEPEETGVREVDWKSLKHATLEERAEDVRLTKADDFAQFLQKLKEWGNKEASFYLMLIKASLEDNAKCRQTDVGRADIALEHSQLQEWLARGGRIRSLVYKRSRSK